MKLHFPPVKTYYILRDENEEIKDYGSMEPNQVLETTWFIFAYPNKNSWLAVLDSNGIDTSEL